MHKGIDIHPQFQDDVNFERVEESGRKFVIIKATEGGNFVVSGYKEYQQRARRANLRTSFYHFLKPRADRTGADEAAFFWSKVKGINAGADERSELLRLVIDSEDMLAKAALGDRRVRLYTLQALDRLAELSNHRPMLYTFPFYLNNWGEAAAEYPLWIADPSQADGHPRLPAPFRDWAIHQTVFGELTNDNVPGVQGGCDENVCLNLSDLILNRKEY